VVAAIAASPADCLFVAMSSPAKERFTEQYKEELGVSFLMGVGGSIDVMAGTTRRAPEWMQQAGLEWLYRVIQEPGRMWKRYLTTNSKFAWLLCKEKFLQRSCVSSTEVHTNSNANQSSKIVVQDLDSALASKQTDASSDVRKVE